MDQKVGISKYVEVLSAPCRFMSGFTLIELLVVVIIIAVLAAVAVPQYRRAALKSRFSTVMPMAKAIADAQEVYYQGRHLYALDTDELDVTPVVAENTSVTLSQTDGYDYVMAQNSKVPGANYIIYQKYSENYPSEIHCEAEDENADANWLCGVLSNNNSIGKTITDGYTTYIINGTGAGIVSDDNGEITEPTPTCPEGATCDAQGMVTQCASGQTLNNGSCVSCSTIQGAATCSTTSYEAISCNQGYTLSSGSCVDDRPNCSQALVGITAASSQATCIQVCEDTDNPSCYKWNNGQTFTSRCEGSSGYACAGLVFAEGGGCDGVIANGCSGVIFTAGSFCGGGVSGSCSDSTFEAGSYCDAWGAHSCDNSTYEPGSWCKHGNAACPANSPSGDNNGPDGQCWDGNGGKKACP